MNNSRLFRLNRIVIALTAASGMMVNTANAKEEAKAATQYTQQVGNDSNLLIVFYVQIMPDDFVMQLHRF